MAIMQSLRSLYVSRDVSNLYGEKKHEGRLLAKKSEKRTYFCTGVRYAILMDISFLKSQSCF
jgi:hypothetical protein